MTHRPTPARVLVLGYGNPGRRDDGLGPAVADAVGARALPGVTVETDYQLGLEDAEAIARHDAVVFVDATTTGPSPFAFTRVGPAAGLGFTTHSLSPGTLLALSQSCFGTHVPGWLLAVRGHDFDDFGEALSPRARANLQAATEFLVSALAARTFHEFQPPERPERASAARGTCHA